MVKCVCIVYAYLWNLSHLMTKPTKWHVRLAKPQISLGICQVWSESLLSAWRKIGSLATRCEHSEDWSDWVDAQLIWVLPGRTVSLLVLSWGGSFVTVFDIDSLWILLELHHNKTCLCYMWTTKMQISLCIHAVWSAPLLFTAWIQATSRENLSSEFSTRVDSN